MRPPPHSPRPTFRAGCKAGGTAAVTTLQEGRPPSHPQSGTSRLLEGAGLAPWRGAAGSGSTAKPKGEPGVLSAIRSHCRGPDDRAPWRSWRTGQPVARAGRACHQDGPGPQSRFRRKRESRTQTRETGLGWTCTHQIICPSAYHPSTCHPSIYPSSIYPSIIYLSSLYLSSTYF